MVIDSIVKKSPRIWVRIFCRREDIMIGLIITLAVIVVAVVGYYVYAKVKGFNPLSILGIKDSYGRTAGNPAICPANMDSDAGLCYPKCADGYYGVGPLCWRKCPEGTTDAGVSCSKVSYDRGVGVIPSICPVGTEESGALCYPLCKDGYYGEGPVCWTKCPVGMTDFGLGCTKNDTYDRGAGHAPTECPPGTEGNGALCYPTCRSGFIGNGPVCWQQCPAGTTDTGAFCQIEAHSIVKDRYKRTDIGTIPTECPVGTERNGALCYPTCKPGFYGNGPVCWQQCPAGTTDTGAFCMTEAHSILKDRYQRADAGTVPF